jgi:hypothetical protein
MECWSADSPKDYSNTRHPSSGSATVDFSTGDGRNEVSETACIRGKTVTFRLDTKEFEPAAHGEVQYDFHNPIVLWSMAGLEHGLQKRNIWSCFATQLRTPLGGLACPVAKQRGLAREPSDPWLRIRFRVIQSSVYGFTVSACTREPDAPMYLCIFMSLNIVGGFVKCSAQRMQSLS